MVSIFAMCANVTDTAISSKSLAFYLDMSNVIILLPYSANPSADLERPLKTFSKIVVVVSTLTKRLKKSSLNCVHVMHAKQIWDNHCEVLPSSALLNVITNERPSKVFSAKIRTTAVHHASANDLGVYMDLIISIIYRFCASRAAKIWPES